MLRAGLIRQSAAGIYSLLPLAVRSFNKVCDIINQEMVCHFLMLSHRYQEAIGAQRLALPCLTPARLWQRSGRWENAGEELVRLRYTCSIIMASSLLVIAVVQTFVSAPRTRRPLRTWWRLC
jgi:prolyl-tRNA synthetase